MNLKSPKLDVEQDRIVAAIRAAELRTSGEIRVVIGKQETKDPIATAKQHFERLGMTKTAARNGVLIFVAPASRNFAVIGDTGVHEKCGDAFWRDVANAMTDRFRHGDFTGGITLAIERAGSLLATHFPRGTDDSNELPDDLDHA